MTMTLNSSATEGILTLLRAVFDAWPGVDEHEFATAYVNHVAETGERPNVHEAIKHFYWDGVVA
jgi:hypothetical protein